MDAAKIADLFRLKLGDSLREVVLDCPNPYLVIDSEGFVLACRYAKFEPELDFDFLESVTGLDLGEKLMVIYHLFSYQFRHSLVIKVPLEKNQPHIKSVCEIWPAANWLEREQFDLFGITFYDHPDLRRIMLPDDWVGHPLLKDYQPPISYHDITHLRPSLTKQLAEMDLKAAAEKKPKAQTVE